MKAITNKTMRVPTELLQKRQPKTKHRIRKGSILYWALKTANLLGGILLTLMLIGTFIFVMAVGATF